MRKQHEAFSGGELEVIATGNDHVLAYMRTCGTERALIFANFSEIPQAVQLQGSENQRIKEQAPVYGTGALREDASLELEPLEFLVYALK
jgi:hypothetical protein